MRDEAATYEAATHFSLATLVAGFGDNHDDDLDLLMSPMSHFDDDIDVMGSAPQSPRRSGQNEAAPSAGLRNIIDLTPSTFDASKVSKTKIVLTTDGSLDPGSPDARLYAAFFIDKGGIKAESLKPTDLCICFSEVMQLSPQTFKAVPPEVVTRKSKVFDNTSDALMRRACILSVYAGVMGDDVWSDVVGVMTRIMSGDATASPRSGWKFCTQQSMECFEVEGAGPGEDDEDLDLPAPLPAMAR